MSIITGYDPRTLRELVDRDAAVTRLDELGALRSLTAISEKVTLFRLLGDFDNAFDFANQALRHTRFSGSREETLDARIRRAQVQHYQGKLQPALSDLTLCADEAHNHEWAELEATALAARGRVLFELGEFHKAEGDFKDAAALFEKLGSSIDQVEPVLVAIAVTQSRLGR